MPVAHPDRGATVHRGGSAAGVIHIRGGNAVKRKAFIAPWPSLATGLVVSGAASRRRQRQDEGHDQGSGGDVYGYVKSTKPNRCADDRKVKVFRQKGGEAGRRRRHQGRQRRRRPNGDRYQWSIGRPAWRQKIYARAGESRAAGRTTAGRSSRARPARSHSATCGLKGLEAERLDRPQGAGTVRVAGRDALGRPCQRLARERVAIDALGADGGEHLAGRGEGLGHEP